MRPDSTPFQHLYPASGQLSESSQKAAVFWQVFMLDRSWVTAHGQISGLPDTQNPRRRVTTPLPTIFDDAFGLTFTNSLIHEIFEPQQNFQIISPSLPAVKILAGALYDQVSRSTNNDVTGISSTIRHSCQVALQRIIPLVPPFGGREAWRIQAPFIDTEIFNIHTIVHACSIYIHLDDYMDASGSLAFNSILELISQLHEQDYHYIDPIIMMCWSGIAKTVVNRLKNFHKHAVPTGQTIEICKVMGQGISVLIFALKTMAQFEPLAGTLLNELINEPF